MVIWCETTMLSFIKLIHSARTSDEENSQICGDELTEYVPCLSIDDFASFKPTFKGWILERRINTYLEGAAQNTDVGGLESK